MSKMEKKTDVDSELYEENTLRRLVFERMAVIDECPNKKLGQHFLVDEISIGLLARSVVPQNTVIEIGAGVGQLTEVLAQRAGEVIAVEIDRRFEPVLSEISRQRPNVQIVYGDALTLDFRKYLDRQGGENVGVQLIASLPYHITEPFLHKITGLPIEDATLVVGERFAYATQAREDDFAFGQLTLLAQTFFDVDVLSYIEKQKFYPVPRTNSVIIRLIPKNEYDFKNSKRNFLLRRLFLTARRSPLVKNVLEEGLIEFARVGETTLSKRELNRSTRRSVKASLRWVARRNYMAEEAQMYLRRGNRRKGLLTKNGARLIIEGMSMPNQILNKPFQQLNNNELGVLSRALRAIEMFQE